jgi:LAO/AO transport system kinase
MSLDPAVRLAVLAVDPSSHVSGGSLLGDRTRVRFAVDQERLFFRSQASGGELGGMSPSTFQVARLLHYLFDLVLIETVGIGQNEIEIQKLADRVYLVMQPFAGDQVQFLKAGIMEIPQVFILNKCDEKDAARRSYHALKTSLEFARPGESDIRIFQTSAVTGQGIDEVCGDLLDFRASVKDAEALLREKESRYFARWVQEEYGRHGLRLLDKKGGPAGFLDPSGGFDLAQEMFSKSVSG